MRGKEDPNSRIGDAQRAKRKAKKSDAMRYAPCSMQSVVDAMPSAPCAMQGDVDAMPHAPCSMQSVVVQSVGDALPHALCSMPDADDRFWALQDINFEVKQGEVLGIIGKNGAGNRPSSKYFHGSRRQRREK